ncbi:MAG: transglycosylase SLT domain-containing protein [Candidatus Sedimenticola sp. (ex Thyasira tokunagai)]
MSAVLQLLLFALLLLAQPAYAVIYKYQDSRGNYHFTDRPMAGRGYRLIWKSGAYSSPAPRSRIDSAAMQRNRSRYTPLIDAVADKVRVNRGLLHAVVTVESLYDPKARSKAGALGLMQLMPETAKRYGVTNRLDPKANLNGGARYLRDLLQLFDNDLKLAVAAYNAGENAVIKYGHRIPPFPETQQYVKKVLALYRQRGSRAGALTAH